MSIKAGAYKAMLVDHVSQELGPLLEPNRVTELPRIGEMPFLTPDTWAAYRDGCVCGDCNSCVFFMRLRMDHFSDPHRKRHRLTSERRARWTSVTAALECYCEQKSEGYAAMSASGVVVNYAQLGTMVQTSGRSTGSSALSAAEDIAEIERALPVAFDDHNSRGLMNSQCLTILFARVVGQDVQIKGADDRTYRKRVPIPAADLAERYGVSKAIVGEIVKSGRFRLSVELIGRGLVAMPRNAPARLQEAVERREAA